MSQNENKSAAGGVTGFISHLLELRDRLLRVIVCLALIFAALFAFANDIYNFLATPLLTHLPQGSSMIAVEVISPFLTPLKMALYASLMLGMPYILYQAWAFVAPGLYLREKRLAMPLLLSSVVLFYTGVAFAYFVVFPLVFAFLISVAPEGVAVMTDIAKYLDFVLALFFAFGLAFEVPVATIIVIAMGLTSADALAQKRPYIIVGAFVLGMLLTPPDVISQVMLALPVWLLFEAGVFMSRVLIAPGRDEDEAENGGVAAGKAESKAGKSDTPPKGYSAAAYPADYTPLTQAQMERELERAAAWDDNGDNNDGKNDEDDNDDNENNRPDKPARPSKGGGRDTGNTPRDAPGKRAADEDGGVA